MTWYESRIVTDESETGGEAASFNVPAGALVTVYLSIGTNMGDRALNLSEALRLISGAVEMNETSSVYETDPVGYTEQPEFWNLVARVQTDLPARQLMAEMLAIENRMGRKRSVPNAPRIIDIDILLYDDVISQDPVVALPHPRMAERAFVLKPLTELAPHLADPRSGERYTEMLQRKSLERAVVIAPPIRIEQ